VGGLVHRRENLPDKRKKCQTALYLSRTAVQGFLFFGSTGLQYRVSSRGLQYRVSVSFVLQDCSTGVPFLLFYRTAVQGFLFFGFYRTAVQGFLFFGSIGLQYRVSYSLVLMD
jgi:hypothetical protein